MALLVKRKFLPVTLSNEAVWRYTVEKAYQILLVMIAWQVLVIEMHMINHTNLQILTVLSSQLFIHVNLSSATEPECINYMR